MLIAFCIAAPYLLFHGIAVWWYIHSPIEPTYWLLDEKQHDGRCGSGGGSPAVPIKGFQMTIPAHETVGVFIEVQAAAKR